MNRMLSNIFKGDKVVWIVLMIFCIISLVEVFSASSNLSYKSNNFFLPMLKHGVTLFIGVVAAALIVNIPCRYFKLATPILYIASLVLLVLVLATGESINGANRVIDLGGLTFQPSEIAKGSVVLAVAQILAATQTEKGAHKKAFNFILWITLPITFLIMIENLSTAVLLFGVVLIMMFIGRVPMSQLGKLIGVLALCGLLGFAFIMAAGHSQRETAAEDALAQVSAAQEGAVAPKKDSGIMAKMFHRADTWKTRIEKFLDDTPVAAADYDLDKDAQVAHANIAIVSSNYVGRGPGNSVERDFLAQAFSDFIFAIIIEETGLEGAFFVVFLYVILLFRASRIASRCDNNFPAFLVMGLTLLLVVQASFNMLVAVGIVPVTGQPLPLISKGGTSTILNCVYIGVILSVSRTAKRHRPATEPVAKPVEQSVVEPVAAPAIEPIATKVVAN